MALLVLGTWSWIGIAVLAWTVISFSFALWLGRVIRVSEQAMEYPPPRMRPHYDSGMDQQRKSGQVSRLSREEVAQLRRDEDATGSHGA